MEKGIKEKVLQGIIRLGEKEGQEVFLVGGYIRDLLLGLPGVRLDIDLLVTGGKAEAFSRAAAAATGGTLVPLGQEKGVFRVYLRGYPGNQAPVVIDFMDFRGASLEEDLKSRDFTINALAFPLGKGRGFPRVGDNGWKDMLIDMSGGLRDLAEKKVRMVYPGAFQEDPLRLLRAVRFSARLGFSLEEKTEKRVKEQACLLGGVSGERVRDELWKIIELPTSRGYLHHLEEGLGLLGAVFPIIQHMRATGQNFYHGENVWFHSLRTYRLLEGLVQEPPFPGDIVSRVKEHLGVELVPGRRRRELLKLFSLFHDAGKTTTGKVLESGRVTFHGHESAGISCLGQVGNRLKLGSREKKILKKLVKLHMRPMHLYTAPRAGPKAYHRVFRHLGEEAVEVLLHSLADFMAKRELKGGTEEIQPYREFITKMLHIYFYEGERMIAPPAVVSGRELIEHLQIEASPRVGNLLEKIREAQVAGQVNNRQQALDLASRLLGGISKTR